MKGWIKNSRARVVIEIIRKSYIVNHDILEEVFKKDLTSLSIVIIKNSETSLNRN